MFSVVLCKVNCVLKVVWVTERMGQVFRVSDLPPLLQVEELYFIFTITIIILSND